MKAGADAPMPSWLILVAFAGSVSALFGGYWDDGWHTERGRDSFFVLPHIFIYVGVAGIGAALSLWVGDTARRVGVRDALSRPTVRLAAASVAVTLASGPIDDIWHRAFGRDAVLWSPPHMLGIVGTMVLGAALLAETARRRAGWSLAAGGLVLAAGNFVVAEYDTDVPQFDALWYLPALALASSVALGLVRMLTARPWAATEAALAHLAFIGLTDAFLLTQGFPPPALPLLVAPALALDAATARGFSAPARTATFVAALFAAYVPVRNWLGSGIEVGAVDVLAGLPLAFAAALPFIALSRGVRPLPPPDARAVAASVLLLALLVPAGTALAHDPGQGEDAGTARLAVNADDFAVAANGRLNRRSCASLRAGQLVARRAGVEHRAPLAIRGCTFSGRLTVSGRGRWFVYAELRGGERIVETWLPVRAGGGRRRVAADARYVYVPPQRSSGAGKRIGGAVLYGAMLLLLVAGFRLLGSSAMPSGAAASETSLVRPLGSETTVSPGQPPRV